jgi:hypothetical protein
VNWGRLAALAAIGALAVTVAGGATVAGAAGTPNACKLLGVTRALAVQLFGPKSSAISGATTGGTPPNIGAYCSISQGPGNIHYKGAIDVEPYAASEFSALVASYSTAQLKQTKLHNLGHGAVFAHNKDPSQDVIEFKRGKYAVLLSSEQAGGSPKNVYPTENMYLTVAHAVYKHLR